jgi:hypothetical protein
MASLARIARAGRSLARFRRAVSVVGWHAPAVVCLTPAASLSSRAAATPAAVDEGEPRPREPPVTISSSAIARSG